MTENCVGMLAYSKCGRDRKRLFCVVDVVDTEFVLVADGNLRTLEKPKKKRLKHLHFVASETLCIPSSNKELYKLITEFENSADRRNLQCQKMM